MNNGNAGVRADGPGATVRLANSNITGNANGSGVTNGAQYLSYGNNHIDGNTVDGPNPGIIPQK